MLEKVFETTNKVMGFLTKFMLGFVSLSVLAEVIFGEGIFGTSVVENIMSLIEKMGDGGFVGLLALIVLVSIFPKKD